MLHHPPLATDICICALMNMIFIKIVRDSREDRSKGSGIPSIYSTFAVGYGEGIHNVIRNLLVLFQTNMNNMQWDSCCCENMFKYKTIYFYYLLQR